MSKLTAGPLPLIAVLLLAAGLRVWGLGWGLPSATHYFSYHPDESRVLQVAMFQMNLFTGRLLPHFYNYGSLQLYLVNVANSLAFVFGAVDIVPKDMGVWYPQWARMYLIGRCLSVVMGVGTVWATCALGTRLWGRRSGLLAGLILAVMPLHAQHSHWMTVDVPATFWVVLSLLWAAKAAPPGGSVSERPTLRAVLLAGVFAGLAAATKYNAVLVLLALVPACLTRPVWGGFSRLKPLLVGLAGALAAFLLACPGAVLEWPQFRSDLRFEAIHVQNTADPTFKDTGSGFVYHIATNLDAGLGLPLLLLSLASVAYALGRRERGDGLLAAFALPYYVLISLAAVRYARYVIPLLPILAVWTGRLVADISRQETPRRLGLERHLMRGVLALCSLVPVLTLGWTFFVLQPMSQEDNRDRALALLNALAPAPARIGFPVQPWFGTAPLSPYFPAPQPGAWRALTPLDLAARIAYPGQDWDVPFLNASRPALVVLSEYDDRDALRQNDPAALAYMKALQMDYEPRGMVGRGLAKEQDVLLGQELPHDMLYTNPTISLYQRKR